MVKFFFSDGKPEVRIDWTILNGSTYRAEDFSGAEIRVWLVGAGRKIPAEYSVFDGGLRVVVPTDLLPSVYGLRALWSVNQCSTWRSEVPQVFTVTDVEEDASPVGGDECVIKVKSASALYCRGGLPPYETAKIKAYYADKAWCADVAIRLKEGGEGMQILDARYLRKDMPDETPYDITMRNGTVKGDLEVFGDLKAHKLIHVDIYGNPVPVNVFCGDWVDGSQMDNPEPRNGIYLAGEMNPIALQYEVHEVRHNSGRWVCLQKQPVDGVYHEPKWNSPYWTLADGDDRLGIEFSSSGGYSFRYGQVNTLVTPTLYWGSVDISNDVSTYFWNWYRCEERNWNDGHPVFTPEDEAWNSLHQSMKALQLTNEDMPSSWSTMNKTIFMLRVQVEGAEGMNVYVGNEIIA